MSGLDAIDPVLRLESATGVQKKLHYLKEAGSAIKKTLQCKPERKKTIQLFKGSNDRMFSAPCNIFCYPSP
ncbi:hypothetical protein [Noviherbaspirillum massiliense]|uniref:hypothetical protein n=1 Tax=Noviherbaspirillum massiliense TaxID=1465823 RepID=UPI0002EBD280|nr:hypothetical protein [Noviherbaspirillum massiliense]